MDGFKKQLRDSIQLRLSVLLSVAILLIAAVAGGLSFYTALDEAHELQDDILRQVAGLMSYQAQASMPPVVLQTKSHDDEDATVIVQRLGATEQGGLSLPPGIANGMHTLSVSGVMYRVLVFNTLDNDKAVVAQEIRFRDEIAQDSALRTAAPLLLLVPLLLFLVTQLIRVMFRPISLLAEEVDRREEHALHPLEDRGIPSEIRPFISAINRLLLKVSVSLDSQKRFVADAAHELRSPLTALSLQAENIEASNIPDEILLKVKALRRGIERSRHLLEQLLSLARVQASDGALKSAVSIKLVFRHVLEEFLPLAELKNIDIGVVGDADAVIMINEIDLVTMVKNIVDNAIKYTPEGGRIDMAVSMVNQRAILSVRDTGPGIELQEREHVFDAFYRTLGTCEIGAGLGLSIVQTIAKRNQVEIRLDFSDVDRRTGLLVEMAILLS